MTVYHDEVEIEDFEYDEDEDLYTYPCVSRNQFKVGKLMNHSIGEIKFC